MNISFEDLNFGDLNRGCRDLWLEGVVVFPGFLRREKAEYLLRLVFDANEAHLLRKDFHKAETNSPRHFYTLNGHILKAVPEIRALYEDPRMIDTLNNLMDITEEDEGIYKVARYRDTLDDVFATRLQKAGDEHGFHTDFAALGLVICLEAPPRDIGGEPEYRLVSRGYYQDVSFYMNVGDAYLMRTNQMLHRVTPLKGDFNRSMINFTYDWPEYPDEDRGLTLKASTAGVFL